MTRSNKKKIFNDPLYGLIMFTHEILYHIIDHRYYQRLRRISQQALSHYVYPGAMHTRFQHALGVCHLATKALDVIKSKGHNISEEESEATCIAALLHDVGHGPFSHALEHTIVDIHHEEISLMLMEEISNDIDYDFTLAIKIFKGEYERSFFHELVSSQLDVDRMDYLMRDSFYSGVAEGIIGYDRIIMMMNVFDNKLVIEEKGLYSVEKFLLARRIMYNQVYMHKTVVAAETMLISILKRARHLVLVGHEVETTPSLRYLLNLQFSSELYDKKEFLNHYVNVDDIDVLHMIKVGRSNSDKILSFLCDNLLERKLFKLSLRPLSYQVDIIKKLNGIFKDKQLLDESINYVFTSKEDTVVHYDIKNKPIYILTKDFKLRKYHNFVSKKDIFSEQVIKFAFVPNI